MVKKTTCYDVVAAVVVHEGKILCMQRGETKYDYTSHKWEFPGGKVEVGESEQTALHRELLEEMDYDVQVDQRVCRVNHNYPDFEITLTAYFCHASTAHFNLKEHADYRWLPIERLDELDWAAADRRIVAELKKLVV